MHTPGLTDGWAFERVGCKVVRSVRYRGASKVADLCTGGLTEVEINSVGRLIAAAPDLLEALREFVREYDGFEDGDGNPCPTLARAVVAIARATAPSPLAGGAS